jgi:hypothetical protein
LILVGTDEFKNTTLPGQPDGIEDDSYDLPAPAAAAERVRAYVSEFGDGLYDVCGGAPLYGRDLEALCRAAARLKDLDYYVRRLTQDAAGDQLDLEPSDKVTVAQIREALDLAARATRA